MAACKFFGSEVNVAPFKTDPQVAHHVLSQPLIAVTGDSDLLVYCPFKKPEEYEGVQFKKLIVMKKYSSDEH